ncbi:MAG: hypothetical protein QOJ49_1392, partial [Actinomycetota bacterium]|nr:hypothetical protein [Actinomycetota bacterium]
VGDDDDTEQRRDDAEVGGAEAS